MDEKKTTQGAANNQGGNSEHIEDVHADVKSDKENQGQKKNSNKRKDKGSNRRGNGRKPGKKDGDKGDKRSMKYNDPSWYGSGQMITDAASIAYSYRTGSPMEIGTYSSHLLSNTTDFILPGIMSIGLLPLVSFSDSDFSVLNTAAQKLYAYVRHANAGSKNYERADLIMYLAAVGELYSFVAWATLAYGLCFTYSQKNAYLGKALVDALGFDYDDIIGHLPDFRWRINLLVQQLNTLYVPKGLTYYDRKINLYSNVIKDIKDPKGTMYVYRPEAFLAWSPLTFTTGSSLIWVNTIQGLSGSDDYDSAGSLFNTKLTFSDFETLSTELFKAMMFDEDAGIIAGDILKAYGASGIRQLSLIPTDYFIEPVTDEEAMEIISNITFAGTPAGPLSGRDTTGLPVYLSPAYSSEARHLGVFQNNGSIFCSPLFGVLRATISDRQYSDAGSAIMRPIFDVVGDPSPEKNMVISRLKAVASREQEAGTGGYFWNFTELMTAGTEVATRMRIYINGATPTDPQYNSKGLELGSSADNRRFRCHLSTFDWHPIHYQIQSANIPQITGVTYDFRNYTPESKETVEKMNQVALYAMFGILSSK